MGSFALFVEYTEESTGEKRSASPIPLRAKSEREASDAAAAVADFLFQDIASNVVIRIVSSDGTGRPEIRRPLSN